VWVGSRIVATRESADHPEHPRADPIWTRSLVTSKLVLLRPVPCHQEGVGIDEWMIMRRKRKRADRRSRSVYLPTEDAL